MLAHYKACVVSTGSMSSTKSKVNVNFQALTCRKGGVQKCAFTWTNNDQE